jgi:hypothetical protein
METLENVLATENHFEMVFAIYQWSEEHEGYKNFDFDIERFMTVHVLEDT